MRKQSDHLWVYLLHIRFNTFKQGRQPEVYAKVRAWHMLLYNEWQAEEDKRNG